MVLDYLYYKIYRGQEKGWGEMTPYGAAISFSILLMVNILVIGFFFKRVGLLSFFESKNQVIFFQIMLTVISFFLFLYNGRYKKIILKYERETELQRKRGNRLVLLYLVFSFILIFVVAFYRS